MELGLRYDIQSTSVRGRQTNNEPYFNNLTFQNITGTIGYKLDLEERLTFNTNLGTSWRNPDASELYGFGKHGSVIQYGFWRYVDSGESDISTSDILDESDKSVKNELGYKWLNQLRLNRSKFQAIFSGYLHLINNYIFATPRGITSTTRGAFPYFIYRQTNALITGVDAEMEFAIMEDLSVKGNAAFVFARDIRYGNYFIEMPPLNLNSQLIYRRSAGRFDHLFSIDLSYTFQKRLAPDVFTPEEILLAAENNETLFETAKIFDFMSSPDGYFLAGIGWEGSVNRYALSIKTENLFNSKYRVYTDRLRYFAPDTGFNLTVSFKYSF